ncbi:MAG: hypothetical protein NC307_14400 [Roseburia sp.]|nr:hypothetical protein [Roseburia sp.]
MIAYDCLLQAEATRLNIEISRRDEKHLQELKEKIMAYDIRLRKLQEERGRTWENRC